MNYINFFIAFIFFIIIDATWIYSNLNYYKNLAYKIQKENLNIKIYASIITYVFLLISFYYCIKFIDYEIKNIKNNLLKISFISFIFGLTIYGIYGYTTCVFLNKYNYFNAFVDMIWGGILYLLSSILYFYLSGKII